MRRSFFRLALAVPLLAAGVSLGGENYGARAELRSPDGKLNTAQVTISLDRLPTAGERDALIAAFRSGDAKVLKKALASQAAIGYVDRGKVRLAIKFASSRPSGEGKMVRIVCDEPMTYLGGEIPDLPARPGFDLAYVLLSLDAGGKGSGEIARAAKLRVEDGSLVVAEYGADVIDLEDVAREK